MKIITLIENKLGSKRCLYSEHGLSLYIETERKKILFDTGQSGNFIENAVKLGVDLKDLNYVIISHGHYDHSGGFKRLIKEINPNIKLYVGKGFFNEKYSLIENEVYKYRGNPFTEKFLEENKIPVVYIDKDVVSITENLLVFTNFNKNEEFENINQSMYLKEGNNYKIDPFQDEISVALKTEKGLIVIVGCSHVGVVNIIDTIKERTNTNIYGLLGGTHIEKEKEEKIDKIVEYLKKNDIKIVGACHCTGKRGEEMLKQKLGEIFIENATGDILKTGDVSHVFLCK